ncbi:hypothetical protein CMI47_06925 [Candidatus Pacearchaeota archaeon]|nr:hypothetical protein [Candidatus Pacearchaeota archaeon]|tara:strand:- start:4998 stop:5627 length:630 start_codon:yes stop_codon:yes gene_type:complete
MPKQSYYNPGNYDGRQGHGYGKAQSKIPSMGTGLGSERIISGDSGIYVSPPKYKIGAAEQDEFFDEMFDDDDDVDAFVAKVNKTYVRADPSRRADRASFATNQRFDLAPLAEKGMPKTSSGISPFSHNVLYPKGFSGPPIGSGGSGQAFRTTGPFKRTGTVYGTSRAPTSDPVDDDISAFEISDILSDDERSLIKQKIRILMLLDTDDE